VSWSQSTLTDEIYTSYTPTFVSRPDNRLTRSRQRAFELYVDGDLGGGVRLNGAYTALKAREDGLEEVRRPPVVASLGMTWRSAEERLGLHAQWRHNGATDDFNFTNVGAPRVRLAAYDLLQVGASLQLSAGFELSARVENALGDNYEDVYTYRTPGRGYFLGLRATR
jgi:vitamin B12 transporter